MSSSHAAIAFSSKGDRGGTERIRGAYLSAPLIPATLRQAGIEPTLQVASPGVRQRTKACVPTAARYNGVPVLNPLLAQRLLGPPR